MTNENEHEGKIGQIDETLLTTKIQEAYKAYLDADHIEKAQELNKVTGIKPLESIVQDKYKSLLMQGNVGTAYGLEKIAGKPQLTNDFMQEVYKKFLTDKGLSLNYCSFDDLKQLTGISPELSEDTIKKAYQQQLEEIVEVVNDPHADSFQKLTYSFSVLKWLSKNTAVQLPEEEFQETYKKLSNLSDYTAACYNLLKLIKISGILPKQEILDKEYSNTLKNMCFGKVWDSWGKIVPADPNGHYFKELKEITNVNPTQKTVQDSYSSLLIKKEDDKFGEKWSKIKELTGILPEGETIAAIQKIYSNCIKESTNNKKSLAAANKLKKDTGIKVNVTDDFMQEIYEIYSKKGLWYENDLQELTEISPDTTFDKIKKYFKKIKESLKGGK